jgi:lysophospholipase L1-like esterase
MSGYSSRKLQGYCMSKTAFIAFLLVGSAMVSAQIPSGAVAANPNVVYYAGGMCSFYDAGGKKLLDVDAAEALWSCSPATAAWVVVTPKSGGYYEFPNYTNTVSKLPHREVMQPFWNGDTIYREAVLLTGPNSVSKLLHQPKKIVAVTNYSGSITYDQDVDYKISGRMISQVSSKPSATYVAKQGLRGNGTPNGLINVAATSWTYVTYVPDRSDWSPLPQLSSAAALPKTRNLLQQRKPLRVQALGMSLTAGLNVSGFAGDPKNFPPTDPYMRGYVDLFCDEIRARYGVDVTLHNSSCGGKTMAWAEKYCEALVNPNRPDLVIIDMGMNDIWGTTTGAAFRASMASTIDKIRAGCPDAEFILIGNMLPDVTAPGAPSDGEKWMYDFLRQLNSLSRPGTAVFDMTTLSDSLYSRKGPSCFTSNSLHPNDYMARWYAQGLAAVVEQSITNVDEQHLLTSQHLQLTINPKPASEYFTVIVDGAPTTDDITASVRSISGELVASVPLHQGANVLSRARLGLAAGWYQITVHSGNASAHTAFVVIEQ